MKRKSTIGVLFLAAFVFGFMASNDVTAQKRVTSFRKTVASPPAQRLVPEGSPLLVENFDYAAGALLTANGWTAHSGAGTNPIAATSPGLTYANYPSSGVGNAVTLTTSGEDVNRTYAVQSSGTVYVAFMVNLTEASTDAVGGYFFHIGPDPISTTFRARVFARKDGSNNISFGISKATTSTAGDISFTPFTFALNTTYLFVIKYTIIAGATNDTVSLFIDPTLPGTEPGSATVTAPDVGATDINPGSVALRQGTAATSPTPRVDGIRIGTSWDDVTGTGGPPASIFKLFNARMNGATEVPPVATTARGYGRVVLNDAETQITASIYYNNLSSGTTLGHIHGPAAVGSNAPPIFDMTPPVGQTTGSAVDRVFAVTPAQVADLRAGLWYFNVHTTNFTGGEIRGQILPANTTLDFDEDGKTDYVVVRDSNGATPGGLIQWHVNLNASPATFFDRDWGLIDAAGPDTSDFLTPADFDGDGKTDIAVWRESTASFYIVESATNAIRIDNFGLAGDEPEIVGDYTGDGKADLAVFRRPTGQGPSVFYYRPSGTYDLVAVEWGDQTFNYLRGDWNADGIYDFGIVAIENNLLHFKIKLSGGGEIDTTFGFAGDIVLPGDYDGDGRLDICVARQDGLFWRWEWDPSSTPGLDTQLDFWGLFASDIPVQGDYNGDGKTDYAVWRPGAQSTFHVMTPLTKQIFSRDWGLADDFPPASLHTALGN